MTHAAASPHEHNLDPIPSQVALFSQDAAFWWKKGGPFDLLHEMNPLRLSYITQTLGNIEGLRILDVGCGGGILTEPLARLGAIVTGIDATPSAIEAAKAHAHTMGLSISYQQATIEAFAAALPAHERFDIVIASEIIEHVTDPSSFLKACCAVLAEEPKGARGIILSTMNRTRRSFLGAILGAEYILRWVPRGTHDWKRFLPPHEIDGLLREHINLASQNTTTQLEKPLWHTIKGMHLNPFTKKWTFSTDLSINYIGFLKI